MPSLEVKCESPLCRSSDSAVGKPYRFRLVIKLDMLELYINDYLMNLKRVQCNGRIGFISKKGKGPFSAIRVWRSR